MSASDEIRSSPLEETPQQSCRARALTVLLIGIGFFCALAPFLRLFEFSNGGENAVVASVQEIHRGGPWLVPTLHEEQRTKKPPLATWLSALAARPATTAKFSDPDPAVRDRAYSDFGWQVRWPSLLAMCGVLAATFVLANTLGGPRLGLFSAMVCGTTVYWLQSARLATTDAHLALWVSVANCLLAAAVFGGRLWPMLLGAGVAMGLAMMSKGPVALVQTVAPVLAFLAWRRWKMPGDAASGARRKWIAPLIVGVVLFMVVGLSWYLLVMWNNPGIWEEWKTEVTREGATGLEPSKWYNYAGLPLVLFPWTFFFVVGLIGTVMTMFVGPAAEDRERQKRMVLALLLVLVPVILMSFFRDRKLRYIIPLLSPASIVAAWGLFELLAKTTWRRSHAALVAGVHWLPLVVATVGLALAASPLGMRLPDEWVKTLKTVAGEPWYSYGSAALFAGGAILLIGAALLLQKRARLTVVAAGTIVTMLLWNTAFNLGYRQSREGSSELRPLAEKILATHPNAKVYSYRADRPSRHAPIDLSIYLNRVVETIQDPADLAAISGPRVYLVRQKHSVPVANPETFAPKAGGPWSYFATSPVDDATWYAFTAVNQGN